MPVMFFLTRPGNIFIHLARGIISAQDQIKCGVPHAYKQLFSSPGSALYHAPNIRE